MYYNGCNQYSYQYGNCGSCQIYPVPFMPTNPLYAHAYVPYQSFTTTFPIGEALMKGTIFPELSNVYNPYEDYRKEEK
ncbi:spore coat associated protein CotJA [Alkaliphilus sp. MSJ-5]|uniref:Spore coat associated protein CotJA n=1 Tax=Alkaliphilus flagellatus TaxID=2841507 RepID=A0ABS6FYP6_9FIRM|nr:spore coat associated protein CotJA [Alkaliphilus flagellatus]